MFGKRKKEIEEIKVRLAKIEERSGSFDTTGALQPVPELKPEEQVWLTEEKKKKAAYALNLCTVSVSQIVDYNNLYILEQEYDGILNNLNLENIPHDEELLDILKRLLDTITFFRIQEGDKRFIEEEYKQKAKSAIWSAVPNLSVILATGNPIAMVTSIVSQVGIGYMNYRKEKAKINLEHEKAKWQLQRAAIEQFNALRRELFATAWKLADRYQFPDSYRLTERQISQYNHILMDSDPIRRYERLDNISNAFTAYPNFHYYIGDAANDIANDRNQPSEVRAQYKKKAIGHFRDFNDLTNRSILRIDPITSACCLELVDLLDPAKDGEEMRRCLTVAMEKAGNSMDILQLCALGYLRLNAYPEAEKLLRLLSVEGYNPNVNASLLSMLYFRDYTSTDDAERMKEVSNLHHTLSLVAPTAVLMPIPSISSKTGIEESERAFVDEKSDIILRATMDLVDMLIEKHTIAFNKEYLKPDGKEHPDAFYLNSKDWSDKIDTILSKKKKRESFLCGLITDDRQGLFENLLDRINQINTALECLPPYEPLADTCYYETGMRFGFGGPCKTDLECINEKLNTLRSEFLKTMGLISSRNFDEIATSDLMRFTIPAVLRPEYVRVIEQRTRQFLNKNKAENEPERMLNEYEEQLQKVCQREEVSVSLDKASTPIVSPSETRSVPRIGEAFYDRKSRVVRMYIKDWYEDFPEDEKFKLKVFLNGSPEFSEQLKDLVNKEIKAEEGQPFNPLSLQAVIQNHINWKDSTLYLTTDSFYYWKTHWFRPDGLIGKDYSIFDQLSFNALVGYDCYRDDIKIGKLFSAIAKRLDSFRTEESGSN